MRRGEYPVAVAVLAGAVGRTREVVTCPFGLYWPNDSGFGTSLG